MVSASFQIFTLTAEGKCPMWKGNCLAGGDVRGDMSNGNVLCSFLLEKEADWWQLRTTLYTVQSTLDPKTSTLLELTVVSYM